MPVRSWCWVHDNVQDMVSKFVDDVKVGGIVESEDGYPESAGSRSAGKVGRGIANRINLDKCKVFHSGISQ